MIKSEQGVTLVETMIATLITLIVITMLGGVIFTATVQNKNQGVEMSRVTVYAQDKIETLMNQDWSGSASTDCTQSTLPATCNTTGLTHSTSWNTGLKAGGTLTYQISCPTTGAAIGYVDYLDAAGNQIIDSTTSVGCAAVTIYAYQRQWLITDVISSSLPTTPGLKRIDVIVWSKTAVNTGSKAPSALLTSYKSQ